MYRLPIFLLMIAAAWHAWRRNPSYSAKATGKFLGALALMTAAVLGVNLWIFKRVPNSPGLGAVLMMATVLAGVLGLTILVIRLSSGTATPLRAGLPIGDIHRHKIRRWAEHAALVMLFLLSPAAIVPAWRLGLLITSGFVLFLFAVILIPLYYQAGLLDRGLAGLQSNPWVHWQYTSAQWEEWTEAQISRLKGPSKWELKRTWPVLCLAAVIFGGIPLLRGQGWQGALAVLGIAAGGVCISVILVRWSERRAPRALRRRYTSAPHEAYVGRDGLFCAGDYKPWLLSGNYLTGVRLDERTPRSLVFQFIQAAGYQTYAVEKPVLIPANAEADIGLIQTRLSEQCPTATLRIAAQGGRREMPGFVG